MAKVVKGVTQLRFEVKGAVLRFQKNAKNVWNMYVVECILAKSGKFVT